MARRTIFSGLRQAALDLWKEEGLAACAARMSAEARAVCIEPVLLPSEWLPERFVLEWYLAAWEGPAQRDKDVYNSWLRQMMDLGFGRVRKLLIDLASPQRIAEQSASLWRHDHDSGSLGYALESDNSAVAILRDHPYVETPLARASISEICRYAIALSRARNVTATHTLTDPRTLHVRVRWQSSRSTMGQSVR